MLPWLKNTCINYNYPLVNSHSSRKNSLESKSQYIRYLHEFHIFHIYIYGTLWFSISFKDSMISSIFPWFPLWFSRYRPRFLRFLMPCGPFFWSSPFLHAGCAAAHVRSTCLPVRSSRLSGCWSETKRWFQWFLPVLYLFKYGYNLFNMAIFRAFSSDIASGYD